jgi:hypothetical protein
MGGLFRWTQFLATFKVSSLSFELWNPPPLSIPIHQCVEDAERKIAGKCWDLQAAQDALAKGELKVVLSSAAQASMVEELLWSDDDVTQFIKCLHKARYNGSEWCLPSKNPKAQAMAADSYVMGFNRFKGIENQAADPWIYFKFSIRSNTLTLLVFSLHASIY